MPIDLPARRPPAPRASVAPKALMVIAIVLGTLALIAVLPAPKGQDADALAWSVTAAP